LEVNGVLDVCRELGISIVAYSPLGRFNININRGFLTGTIQNNSEIPEGDFRKSNPRFVEKALEQNKLLLASLN
jgi:aryl-alcohol dehydrogenase-like predicted oxidoreductase